jgi:hypothetical protein
MKQLFAQLAGIARYELRLQWRRGGLAVLMAGLVALLLLTTVLFARFSRQREFYSGDAPQPRMSQSTMSGTWLAAVLILTLFLPILAAETLPLDRQHGVRELLDSLPVRPGLHLAGRLLGLWAGVLGSLAVAALVDAAAGRPWHGPLDLGRYAALWLGSLAPAALFLSAAALLFAAPLPNRRAAALFGIVLGVFSFFGQASASRLNLTPLTAVWPPYYLRQLNLLMSSLLETDYRAQVAALGVQVQYFGPSPWQDLIAVPLLCALGPLQLVAPGLVAWLWLRWKATR